MSGFGFDNTSFGFCNDTNGTLPPTISDIIAEASGIDPQSAYFGNLAPSVGGITLVASGIPPATEGNTPDPLTVRHDGSLLDSTWILGGITSAVEAPSSSEFQPDTDSIMWTMAVRLNVPGAFDLWGKRVGGIGFKVGMDSTNRVIAFVDGASFRLPNVLPVGKWLVITFVLNRATGLALLADNYANVADVASAALAVAPSDLDNGATFAVGNGENAGPSSADIAGLIYWKGAALGVMAAAQTVDHNRKIGETLVSIPASHSAEQAPVIESRMDEFDAPPPQSFFQQAAGLMPFAVTAARSFPPLLDIQSVEPGFKQSDVITIDANNRVTIPANFSGTIDSNLELQANTSGSNHSVTVTEELGTGFPVPPLDGGTTLVDFSDTASVTGTSDLLTHKLIHGERLLFFGTVFARFAYTSTSNVTLTSNGNEFASVVRIGP